jgi:hypothetical protein
MKNAPPIVVMVCLALLAVSVAAQEDTKDPCSSYQQCSEMGTKELKAGKIDEAIVLFKWQGTLAEEADIRQGHVNIGPGKKPVYSLGILAYNNLALAYMHKGDLLEARAWCNVALRWDKNNKTALHNLGQIQKNLRRDNWILPDPVTGTYVQYAGRGYWNIFIVQRDEGSKISIFFSGMWWGPGHKYGPSGIGEFRGTTVLNGKSATYHGDADFPCTVRMEFSFDKVELKQDGSCGFGHNVEANGIYERVSTSGKMPADEKNVDHLSPHRHLNSQTVFSLAN